MEPQPFIRNTQDLKLKQRLRFDPKVLLTSSLLALPQHELEEFIEQELADNPALERLDADTEDQKQELAFRLSGERPCPITEDFETFAAKAFGPTDDLDWTDFVASPISLHDHILAQLLALVPPEQENLARFIVDCVNSKGYLEMPIEEIANVMNVPLTEAQSVLSALQTCDPPGIGAHDLRECLDLQLQDTDDRTSILARAIIKRHWTQLLEKNAKAIARRYKTTESDVLSAFNRISSLQPYPGEAFVTSDLACQNDHSIAITPDIVFKKTDAEIQIHINGCDPSEFMIERYYKEKYRSIFSVKQKKINEDAKHIKEFVNRAVNFIKALHQRRITLKRIAQHLLKEQYSFIATGSYEHLKAITRTKVAKALNIHESTVSRATMGKHVQITNGEVIPFEVFFKPALRIQRLIEEILLNEDPNNPMSDREISEILQSHGVKVARRTVNKYREQVRLLSSRRRRSA